MKKQPHTWEYKVLSTLNPNKLIAYKYCLTETEVIETVNYDGEKIYTYGISDYFKTQRKPSDERIAYELYKAITSADCPIAFDDFDKKRWQFWQAFDHEKIVAEELLLDPERGYPYTYSKYGIGSVQFDWQNFENFFFEGPKKENLPLDIRKKMRAIIFQAMTPQKHQLSLKMDAFPLFDYNKIKAKKWQHGDQHYGEALELRGASIVISSWEPNPKNCGGGSWSIEHFWRNMNQRIPYSFRAYIPEIRAVLEQAIVEDEA